MSEYFLEIVNGVKTFLTGMKMTLKHYSNKEDLVATLQYPHEKWPIPERDIGFENSEYNLIRSRLHVDIDDCIGCLQCERVCPVDCIKIDTIKPPKGQSVEFGMTSNDTEKKMLVTRFTIDMAECMYCNLCAYPCPEECIYMVGGPNEQKHEIDYEFSKYERDGLQYEFAFPTEAQILEVGGEKYLEVQKAKVEKFDEGSRLEGFVEEEKKEVKVDLKEDKSAKEEESGLTLKVFNNVNDKPARGVAKKAFQAAKRNSLDYVAMADYVDNAINEAGKSSPEMTEAIEVIRNYKVEVAEAVNALVEDLSEGNNSAEIIEDGSVEEFTVKSLNGIEDKMSRGIAKKAFTAAKRESLDSAGKVKAIIAALEDAGKMDSEIESLLKPYASNEASSSGTSSENSKIEEKSDSNELFSIKELDVIDDKMVRGSLKKVYMAGKRGGKSSEEVVGNMKSLLLEDGTMSDDIEKILNGLI